MTSRLAAAGATAVAVALAVAELAAALLPAVTSPLDAVGQVVVGVLPGSVVSWAIGTFGGANRTVLAVASVVVACGLGAGVAGVAWRRTVPAWVPMAAVALLVLPALLAQPGNAFPTALLTLTAAAAAGTVTLARLLGRLRIAEPEPGTGHATPTDPDLARRTFLRVTLGAGVLAAGTGVVARQVGRTSGAVRTVPDVVLPAATAPLPPVAAAQDLARSVDGVSPVLTPTGRFFRIDTAISLPLVDLAGWTLTVQGLVDRPFTLTYDDLLTEDLVEVDATIACVSNEVGGDLIGTARWLGVPLARLLERAQVQPGGTQVLGRAVDGFTAGFPLDVLDDGRPALVAGGMNGVQLPVRHGFPARLVVPGLFGYVSATKWLASIELTSWEDVDGYWIPRGWSKEGPVKTGSRIDRPREPVPAGAVTVAGVAWAPTRGIARVEVRIDDGPWASATLVEPLADTTWVQWHLDVEVAAGDHRVQVRAVDGAGAVQPSGPRPPAPDGAEGWHVRRVTAT